MSRVSLATIVEGRRAAVAARRAVRPLAALEALAAACGPTRGFAAALAGAPRAPGVIAEVKKASPSGGLLRPDFEPEAIARAYAAAGASCLSVLTEEPHFQGDMSYLARIREVVSLPLLQKDFVIDPYQVVEARVAGADAVLLIAAILDDGELQSLAALAASLGLDVLLEVHDEQELERALSVPTPLLGINHRNLKTYAIDLATSGKLIARMGERRGGRLIVGESGIRTAADVAGLVADGVDAVLVGETMMRQPDLAAAYSALFGA